MALEKPVEKIERITAKVLHKHTGKTWDEWIETLDKANAKNWERKDIVELLRKKRVTPWWQQIVTRGYLINHGRQSVGRNLKGQYSIAITKSCSVTRQKLWRFLLSAEGQEIWLNPLTPISIKPKTSFERTDGVFGEIRTIKAQRSIRLTWQETEWVKPTVVQVMIFGRDPKKAHFGIMHENLVDGRLREPLRTHWRDVATRIQEALKKF